MTTAYFPESNTRTYTKLMTGLLQRNLLPPRMQTVIEPHLEWRLTTSAGQGFRRYGAKGGSLATIQGYSIVTWTAYVETQQNVPGTNHGYQAVATIHLVDRANGSNALLELIPGVTHFADALVTDPAFATTVFNQLPADPALPDLIAHIDNLGPDDAGKAQMTKIRVLNIGTAPTMHSTEISVFLSNSSQVNPGAAPVYVGQVPPLRPGGEVSFTFWIHSPGKFCIVMVDPRNAVAESDKGNNVQYEQLFWLR